MLSHTHTLTPTIRYTLSTLTLTHRHPQHTQARTHSHPHPRTHNHVYTLHTHTHIHTQPHTLQNLSTKTSWAHPHSYASYAPNSPLPGLIWLRELAFLWLRLSPAGVTLNPDLAFQSPPASGLAREQRDVNREWSCAISQGPIPACPQMPFLGLRRPRDSSGCCSQ